MKLPIHIYYLYPTDIKSLDPENYEKRDNDARTYHYLYQKGY